MNLSLHFQEIAAAGLLVCGFVVLWARKKLRSETWTFSVQPRATHLIQACVQLSVYVYMSRFSPGIGRYAPLIVAQLVFAFAFDFLASVAIQRAFVLGFSVLPIVLSINFFIWFYPRLFFMQLMMVAVAVLSKYVLVRAGRDGRLSHIFNPSAFAMLLATLVVLAAGPLKMILLDDLETNYAAARTGIYAFIFFAGCVSQFAGRVHLVAAGAFFTMFLASGLCYLGTGLPVANHLLDPSTFLGITLLITDPKSCPKKWSGQWLFGVSYAVMILLSYGALSYMNMPGYFQKILPVSLLNFVAPAYDRLEFAPQILRRRAVQLGLYVALFLALSPLAQQSPRQVSFLGRLGGAQWAARMRR